MIITSNSNFLIYPFLLVQTDEDILNEVIKMGFDRDGLIESLRNRVQNEVITFIIIIFLGEKYW